MEVNIADILRTVPDILAFNRGYLLCSPPSIIKCQDGWYNPEDICWVQLHQLLKARMSGTILRISAVFTSINY
jgi:hypothetical protein